MSSGDTEEELTQSEMSFGEHLEELRRRLFKALLASIAGLILVFIRHEQVLAIVTAPYRETMEGLGRSPALNAFSVQGPFFVSVKVSFIVGLILTAPIWIYQVWAFIAAGLYKAERKIIYRFVPFCVLLFLGGVFFGYQVLVPIGLAYLLTFADPAVIQNTVGVSEYLSLFTLLTAVLGIAFQLPVVMVGVARAGLLTPRQFQEKRKWMILGLFVLAALITPPDPITQILLASPLVLLYELGIVMAWFGLGSDRGKIDWGHVGRTLRKPAILILLLVLLAGPLDEIRKADQADGRLLGQAEAAGALDPWRRVLGEEPLTSFVVAEDGPDQWLVIRGSERVAIGKLTRTTRNFIPLDSDETAEGGPTYRFRLVEAGELLLTYQRPSEVAVELVVDGLLGSWEAASEGTVPELTRLLVALTGVDGAGGAERDAAFADRVRAWRDARAGQRFVQVIEAGALRPEVRP